MRVAVRLIVGVALRVGVGVMLGVADGVGEGVALRVRVWVAVVVRVGVTLPVMVAVGLAVVVRVAVALAVGDVLLLGVAVGVRVAVSEAVAERLGVAVAVRDAVTVMLRVAVAVPDGVTVLDSVAPPLAVAVAVRDGVAVSLGVDVAAALLDGVAVATCTGVPLAVAEPVAETVAVASRVVVAVAVDVGDADSATVAAGVAVALVAVAVAASGVAVPVGLGDDVWVTAGVAVTIGQPSRALFTERISSAISTAPSPSPSAAGQAPRDASPRLIRTCRMSSAMPTSPSPSQSPGQPGTCACKVLELSAANQIAVSGVSAKRRAVAAAPSLRRARFPPDFTAAFPCSTTDSSNRSNQNSRAETTAAARRKAATDAEVAAYRDSRGKPCRAARASKCPTLAAGMSVDRWTPALQAHRSMSRRVTQSYRAAGRSRLASALWIRLAATLAALAVAAVSVQAGFGEVCSLCPVDCPMHAAHGVAAAVDEGASVKIRCHGAEHESVGVDLAFRRPPCRGSATLSTSLLPPFVLGAPTELPAFAPYSLEATDAHAPVIGRSAVPETPPPISFA